MKNITLRFVFNFFMHIIVSGGLVMSLASCGGGTGQAGTSEGSSNNIQSSVLAQSLGTASQKATTTTTSWTNCAAEDAVCSFSGTRQVRYGANGIYFYKTATDSIACTNAVFGDPVPNVDKVCAYATTTTTTTPDPAPSTTSWTRCASEGATCSFSGTRQVRYGANGVYAYRSATGSIQCSNAVFGDPVPYTSKACDYLNTTTSTTTSPTPSPTPTSTPTPTPTPTSTSGLPTSDPQLGSCAGYKQVGPIQINGQSNVVIDGVCVLNAPGNCVEISNSSNVTIRNSKFGSCGQGVVYALNSTGIKVENNILYNPHFNGGQGQFVQFNNVTGGGNRIRFNRGYSVAGQSNTEDGINMYKSSGASNDPIMIYGNKIDGGGPSTSGGGILLGDNGGSYQCAVNNIVINPGQYGMSIAGGSHLTVKNNKIYSKQQSFSNVGLYLWNQYSPPCDSNKVQGNKIWWINSSGAQNPSWNAGNCSNTTWDSNTTDSSLTETSLRNESIPFYDETTIKSACQ